MHSYLKPTCSLLVFALTTLAVPRGWAQELPEPPHGGPPVTVDVSGDEAPFTYVTVGFQSCRLPCRLTLQPGLQPVIATGKASFISHIEVPRDAARLDFVDVTGAYRTAGAILIPTGIVTAASLWAIGLGCSGGCLVANFAIWPVLGISAMFTGIGLLGYSAGRERFQLRARPGFQSARMAPRLTALAAAPTADGAAMGAAFVF